MNTNDTINELLRILDILRVNGVDITKIPVAYTKEDGKRALYKLNEIKQDGIDIEHIIEENNLDGSFNIGYAIVRLRRKYVTKELEQEIAKKAEELGAVTLIPEGRETPIFKGRKVSKFHVSIVEENLNAMIAGELNTKEILEIINKRAQEVGEYQIKDGGTVKRIVAMILVNRPDEYKKYEEALRHAIGARSPKSLDVRFKSREKEFDNIIIEQYLPRILAGEITIATIIRELQTSDETIYKIIRKHYSNDEVGWENFKAAIKKNRGTSFERREKAKSMRKEIAGFKVVPKNIFLMLSEEEQDEQIIMKIRQEKLKEELSTTSKRKTAAINDDVAKKQVEKIKDYFRRKNDADGKKIYFSEQDIRALIFTYPTIINRDEENLDEKIAVLTSYEKIDEEIAYGMIKTFPAILGYSAQRTKIQLDLLQTENLIDFLISNPRGFMMSPVFMYALIQYAKYRHNTADLSEIARNNIFLSNSILKKVYGMTSEELKIKYPAPAFMTEEQKDVTYSVDGQELGMVGYTADIDLVDQATSVVEQLVVDKTKEERKE